MTDLLAPQTTYADLGFVDFVDRSQSQPAVSMANVIVALRLLRLQCSYDVFRDKYLISGTEFGDGMQMTDAVGRKLRLMVRKRFKFDPGQSTVMDGLYAACEANAFHPVIDALDRTRWDGVPRIDSLFSRYFGAADNEYTRALGRLLLIAAVRRIRVPGSKYDMMVVLEGTEGSGKSSGLRILFGSEFFSDQQILGTTDKELQEVLRGRWCIEVAELAGMRKAEIEKIKAAITREVDRARPAYARATVDIKRSAVLVATTNDDDYLKALSGENRRFGPVKVGRTDFKALERDRKQLWAEADAEEPCHGELELPRALWSYASAERATRMQSDPWADILDGVAASAARAQNSTIDSGALADDLAIFEVADFNGSGAANKERIASSYILSDVLAIPSERQTAETAKRVGRVMRQLGWTGPKKIRIRRHAVQGYSRMLTDEFADLM
jgi:virulence-associated protein E